MLDGCYRRRGLRVRRLVNGGDEMESKKNKRVMSEECEKT